MYCAVTPTYHNFLLPLKNKIFFKIVTIYKDLMEETMRYCREGIQEALPSSKPLSLVASMKNRTKIWQ